MQSECTKCVDTNLCVQTKQTNLSSVDDLSHRVCTGPIKVLLKLARLNQLSLTHKNKVYPGISNRGRIVHSVGLQ